MDRRTLFTVQAALLIFLGMVVLISYWKQPAKRRDSGSPWFGAGFICAGIGLLLQSFRGIAPPFVSIMLGNGIFMLFNPLCARAISRTTGQRLDYMPLLIGLNVATLLNFAYFTWWQPNVLLRTLEAIVVVGVMHLACVDLLLRNKDQVIRVAVRSLIAAYVLHFIPNVLRGAMAWKLQAADAWFSWFGIVTIAWLAVSYLWIGNLRSQDELERSAMTDPLTGLFNRRALNVLAQREIEHSRRRGVPCSALMMDVDRFKSINDSLGHAAGDATLCAIASILQTTLRVTDLATRVGGDEFFVLLPDCDDSQAALITARINTAVSGLQMRTMGGEPFGVTASVGRVTVEGPDFTLEDLLHASDIMLYRQKQMAEPAPDQRPAASQAFRNLAEPTNA